MNLTDLMMLNVIMYLKMKYWWQVQDWWISYFFKIAIYKVCHFDSFDTFSMSHVKSLTFINSTKSIVGENHQIIFHAVYISFYTLLDKSIISLSCNYSGDVLLSSMLLLKDIMTLYHYLCPVELLHTLQVK